MDSNMLSPWMVSSVATHSEADLDLLKKYYQLNTMSKQLTFNNRDKFVEYLAVHCLALFMLCEVILWTEQGVHSVRKSGLVRISVTLGMVRKIWKNLEKRQENLEYCSWSGKTPKIKN